MSSQVTYETNHISLLCDSTMSSALNFCFLIYFSVILKKKNHIRRNINSKKEMFFCEISIIILICRKLGSVGPVQQKSWDETERKLHQLFQEHLGLNDIFQA